MKKKPIVILILAVLIFAVFPVEALALVPTPVPLPHPDFLDPEVSVPDAALSEALHTLTGVAVGTALRKSDLETLTGRLDLNFLGIENAEGLQYCTNVEILYLCGNALSDMPDMAALSELRELNLIDNDFSSVSEGICAIPNLQILYMDGNPITRISASIGNLSGLERLTLSNTELDAFPDVVLSMNLKTLGLSYTPIGEVPSSISQMTTLKELRVSGTGIDSLPDCLCGMGLTTLGVADNDLYELPEGICPGLIDLDASGNRLTSMPQSLLNSTTLSRLDMGLNRLTDLPSEFANKTFSYVNIEFNFLDVSSGSEARSLIDANNSQSKFYEHQLALPEVTALAGNDSVTLGWARCPDGSDDVSEWEVTGYVVYQYTGGELVKLADLDSGTTQYTHEGLAPGTAYSYRIGVNYHVYSIVPTMFESTTRGYTRVDVTTTAAGEEAQTTQGAPAVSPEAKSVEPDESYAIVTETPLPALATDGALSTAAIIVIAAGAAVFGAGAAVLAILLVIRKRGKAQ